MGRMKDIAIDIENMYYVDSYTPEEIAEYLQIPLSMVTEHIAECDDSRDEDEPDQFNSDAEADADALASAGWGTDEDYGGGNEYL